MINTLKIKPYIKILRPFTLVPPFFAAIFGGILGSLISGTEINLFKLIFAGISLSLCQGFGQIDNQLNDPEELDIINNKGDRPLIKGELSRIEANIFSVIILILSLIFALLTNNEMFVFSICLLVLCIILYNREPFRLKKHLFINNLILGLSRGLIPFIATVGLFGGLNEEVIIYSIGITIWVLFWNTTKDINDIEGDRKFGINTIPAVFGMDVTKKFLIIGSLIFIIYSYILISPIVSLIFLILSIIGIKNLDNKNTITKLNDNTISWGVFYAGIIVYYISLIFINIL